MLAIYKREMRSYFTGVIGYAFLVIFLAIAGIVFCYSTLFSMSADVTAYFTVMLLFSAIILPILTMKSFSEERKAKTEQLLLTSPISLPAMVIGKFLAAFSMFAMATVFTSLYFLILLPYGNVQIALLIGNLIALLLVGMLFISIGLFVSSLTENQLSAAVGTIAIIIGLLGVSLIGTLIPEDYWLRFVFNTLSVYSRFQAFTAGYFDLPSLIYYLSVSALFLFFTFRVYDRRRYN